MEALKQQFPRFVAKPRASIGDLERPAAGTEQQRSAGRIRQRVLNHCVEHPIDI